MNTQVSFRFLQSPLLSFGTSDRVVDQVVDRDVDRIAGNIGDNSIQTPRSSEEDASSSADADVQVLVVSYLLLNQIDVAQAADPRL